MDSFYFTSCYQGVINHHSNFLIFWINPMEKKSLWQSFYKVLFTFQDFAKRNLNFFGNVFSLIFIKSGRLNRVLKFLLFPTYRKYAVAKQQGVSSLAANLRRCLGEVWNLIKWDCQPNKLLLSGTTNRYSRKVCNSEKI